MKQGLLIAIMLLPWFVGAQLPSGAFKKGLAVGETVPDFVSTTPDEESLSLEELANKHKLVLIDFWASWCLPCRAEIPNIRKVYDAFKDEGFTVLSVAQDFNAVDWNKAIAKDSVVWYNVSSLQGREEPIAKMFHINVIPAAILVDSNRTILAIDAPGSGLPSNDGSLKGEALFLKVKAFFDGDGV